MDSDPLPHQGTAWRTARGCIGIWVPCSTTLVVALRGHGDAQFARPILTAYERLQPAASLNLFFDLEGMTSYESRLATLVARRILPDRRRVSSLEALVTSRSATMGLGIVGITIGRAFDAITGREQFQAAINRRLTENRVIGFSAEALKALSNTA